MASPFFRSILHPTQTFGMDDLNFAKGLSSGMSGGSAFGSYGSLISTIASGFDFFKDLAEPDFRQPGMTSQEASQVKKNSDFGTASKGANFALQLLFTILMFAL